MTAKATAHDEPECYSCSGWPGPTNVSDEWRRWYLDFRPEFIKRDRVRVP